jgi:hypothetical protein
MLLGKSVRFRGRNKAGGQLDNLCYALNGYKGIHSAEYNRAVYKWLQTASKGKSGSKLTEAVQKALRDMAKILDI